MNRQDLHVGQVVRLKYSARHVHVLQILAMGMGFSPTLAMVEVKVIPTGEVLTVESTSLIL